VPARASWLTGLWPSQLGITRNGHYSLPADSPSFVRELNRRRWHTALIGKTHWHPHGRGVDLRDQAGLLHQLGFSESEEIAGPKALAEVRCALTDAWEAHEPGLQERYRDDLEERHHGGPPWRVRPTILPTALYPDVWVADRACQWLRRRGRSAQPWFLWVSFPGPHEPWDTPLPWAGIHRQGSLPAPAATPPWLQRQPAHSEVRQRQLQWADGPPSQAIAQLRADYADHLALLDQQLARLLAALPEPSRTSVTVVSDHGELLGDAGLLYKGCFLEGAVRSLALHARAGRWRPWRPRRLRDPVGLSWFLGAAAQELLGERQPLQHGHGPWAFSEFGSELLVTDRHRKLVLDREGMPLWATDLRADPDEQRNLLEDPLGWDQPWQTLLTAGRDHQRCSG
jgi:choline-sulfatase